MEDGGVRYTAANCETANDMLNIEAFKNSTERDDVIAAQRPILCQNRIAMGENWLIWSSSGADLSTVAKSLGGAQRRC